MASGKGSETCKQCKQFRMMCMCPQDGSYIESQNGDKERIIKTKGTVTLNSLAIYASALKRKGQRQASLHHKPPNSNLQTSSTERFQCSETSQAATSTDLELNEIPNRERIQVSPGNVPIGVKKKLILRLIEAVYVHQDDSVTCNDKIKAQDSSEVTKMG